MLEVAAEAGVSGGSFSNYFTAAPVPVGFLLPKVLRRMTYAASPLVMRSAAPVAQTIDQTPANTWAAPPAVRRNLPVANMPPAA